MPLWAVILVLGAAGSGWLFLKARQSEVSATYKRVGGRAKSVRKAAKHLAKQPSGVEVAQPVTSQEEVNFSADVSSHMAKTLEDLMEEKQDVR